MKKIYTLIVLAGISANLSAQSIIKSNLHSIKKTIPSAPTQRAERLIGPDTLGLVNFIDFLPQFAPSSSYILYSYGGLYGGGYVFGNNSDSTTVCAQGYANLNNAPVRVLGVLVWFGAKQSDAGSAPTSKVVIKSWGISANKSYNTDGSGTFNNTVANWAGPSTNENSPDASVDLLFSTIDTANLNYVSFAVPPVYSGDFAVGVDFSTLAAGDTTGLVSDSPGDAYNIDYNFQIFQHKWFVTDQIYSPPGSPDYGTGGMDNSLAIWAIADTAHCYAHYTTTYDTVLNTFNLTVDPSTASFATAYHWDFGDGSTSALPNPTHIYAVDSLYNVCMKIYTAAGDSCEYCHTIGIDSLGNAVHSTGFTLSVTNSGAVSVNEIPSESTISIYPNPFTSQTTIVFSADQSRTTIILTDILGKEIRYATFSGKQFVIEKGDLQPGLYMIKTIDEQENICVRKIIVQ